MEYINNKISKAHILMLWSFMIEQMVWTPIDVSDSGDYLISRPFNYVLWEVWLRYEPNKKIIEIDSSAQSTSRSVFSIPHSLIVVFSIAFLIRLI